MLIIYVNPRFDVAYFIQCLLPIVPLNKPALRGSFFSIHHELVDVFSGCCISEFSLKQTTKRYSEDPDAGVRQKALSIELQFALTRIRSTLLRGSIVIYPDRGMQKHKHAIITINQ